MFLRSLSIENFRSIRSAELEFDDTTVLIGENGYGKSSLFEALARTLAADEGAPRFEAQHFHREHDGPAAAPVGPICIELTFEERAAGEWNAIELGALASLVGSATTRPRQLILRVQAEPPSGSFPVEGQWQIFSPGSSSRADDLASLVMLRSLNRLVWLHAGSLLGTYGNISSEPEVDRPVKEDIAPLAKEIQKHQQALESGTSRHEQSELKAGYEAALELLSLRAVESHSSGALSGSLVEEILAQRGLDAGQRAQSFHGSAAQQLGVLILTAAILRHHPGVPITGAEFIMVFEDPEAHLHLMTLASVWGLLDNLEAQKIISTQSGTLLAAAPLYNMRRMTRHDGVLTQWRVLRGRLKTEELRKLSYHIRVRRADASFARCWLLVEGETEFWMLPELARLSGYDLTLEGIACVEFAQCGLVPLIKVAQELGIEWHVLTDGDKAGKIYAETARTFLRDEPAKRRVTTLRQRDIENCFWKHGYEQVFAQAARVPWKPGSHMQPRSVINKAIKRHSKPHMAFELIVAAAADDSPGVPAPLSRMLDTCVQLARQPAQPHNDL